MGRSGTTWLGRELLSYNTHYIHEPRLTAHLGAIAALGDGKRSRRIDLHKEEENYFFSNKFKTTWKFFLRKLILNRFYSQVVDLEKKVIIKEADVIDTSDIISDCFPNSKIIILVRDGRDVLDSSINGRQKDGWMTKSMNGIPINEKKRSRFIRNRSQFWVNLTENLLRTHTKHTNGFVYLVKYEDMLKDTQNELEKIYKFLEINISKDKIQNIVTKYDFSKIPAREKGSGKFYRSASPGLWREHFSDEEQNMMNEIMGNTLKKVGYEI